MIIQILQVYRTYYSYISALNPDLYWDIELMVRFFWSLPVAPPNVEVQYYSHISATNPIYTGLLDSSDI